MISAAGQATFCCMPTALWPQAAQANRIMDAGSEGQDTPVTLPLKGLFLEIKLLQEIYRFYRGKYLKRYSMFSFDTTIYLLSK